MQVIPGWNKVKKLSLEGDFPEFRFTHQASGFEIVSDHRGVVMKGTSHRLVNPDDYDNFAWALGEAGREAVRLKRGKIEVVGDNELEAIKKNL